ncbi:MAG: glycoside hydrolase family 28 protein [Spirochaetes bacterium]|nr:glycoside hydrolase family 28 protein [Spirochaetota bacterium]
MNFEKLLKSITPPQIPNREYQIENYGAVGDGITDNTKAINYAINTCSNNGGGKIIISKGSYLTGPVKLKSNIELHIKKDSSIIFKSDFNEYLPVVFTRWEGVECFNYSPLIYAINCENIAITGKGKLLGNGVKWWHWKKLQYDAAKKLYDAESDNIPVNERIFGTEEDALRPPFIQTINCKNILLEGITVSNGPFWTIHPVYCKNFIARNLKILTEGPNTDGLNPDSCENVLIENCFFETGDDCIAISSGMNEDGWRVNRQCENILIRKCIMKSGNGGVVIGSPTSGGIKNIYVEDCIFDGLKRGIRLKSMLGRGGYVENINYNNIIIKNTRDQAIIIDLHYALSTVQPKSKTPPKFKNIHIKNVTGENADTSVQINGIEEELIENVSFENINLKAKKGFYACHVNGLYLNKISINSEESSGIKLKNIKNLDIKESNFI